MVTKDNIDIPFKKDDILVCSKDVKWPNSTTGHYSYSFKKDEVYKLYGININFGTPKLMLIPLNGNGIQLTKEIDSFRLEKERK